MGPGLHLVSRVPRHLLKQEGLQRHDHQSPPHLLPRAGPWPNHCPHHGEQAAPAYLRVAGVSSCQPVESLQRSHLLSGPGHCTLIMTKPPPTAPGPFLCPPLLDCDYTRQRNCCGSPLSDVPTALERFFHFTREFSKTPTIWSTSLRHQGDAPPTPRWAMRSVTPYQQGHATTGTPTWPVATQAQRSHTSQGWTSVCA